MTGAIELLRARTEMRPKVAVVLGSGLGAFAEGLAERVEVPYSEIPGWPQSTAVGHAGMLVFGRSGGKPVVVMAGRAHLYEGYTPAQVVFGVRVLAGLGVRTIVFTNAAGGINLEYQRGGLVLISDHINLQGTNPLVGPGARFPDMTEAYSPELRRIAKEVAADLCIPLREGVYAGLLGPNFETPAEIRFLRTIGADLVGMSTVQEVIAANDLGLRVLGVSCVTNMAAGVLPQKITHEEVLAAGDMVRDTLSRFLAALLARLED
jgi:purine-nucleoside phosphorylase